MRHSGPGSAGLLTELISWQSIFLVQVPVAAGCAAVAGRPGAGPRARATGSTRRSARPAVPTWPRTLALALVSAALAAALFLVVLLLIEGWLLTPIAAAAAVSVTPICALAAAPLASRVESPNARAAAGTILIAGGLAGLALLPDASVALTLPPQALVGAGLALTLSALTEAALAGRSPQAIHGGWTIAARHAGVVAGLLVLTPVFTADLDTERANAQQAGIAALLDADTDPSSKLALANRIADEIDAQGDKVPDVRPAFEPLPDRPRRARRRRLAARDDRGRDRQRRHPRVHRLVPDRHGVRARRADPDRARATEGRTMSPRLLVGGAAALSLLLAVVYLAAGGGSYEPTPVADPCEPRAWTEPGDLEETAQQFFLSALDGAACELGVSREELAAALATEESRAGIRGRAGHRRRCSSSSRSAPGSGARSTTPSGRAP